MRRRLLVFGMLVVMGLALVANSASPSTRVAMVTVKLRVRGAVAKRLTWSHPIASATTPDYGCLVTGGGTAPGLFGLAYNGEALVNFDFSKPGLILSLERFSPRKPRYTKPTAITMVVALGGKSYSAGGNSDRQFKPTVVVRAGGRSGTFSAARLVDPQKQRISVVGSWRCDKVAT